MGRETVSNDWGGGQGVEGAGITSKTHGSMLLIFTANM